MLEKNAALYEIVSINADEVLLDSGLSSAAFGKLRIKPEHGMLVHNGARATGVPAIEPWSFTTTKIAADSTGNADRVYYAGQFASGACTLHSQLVAGGKRAQAAAVAACTALSTLIAYYAERGTDVANGVPLFSSIGAGGIIVRLGADGNADSDVLFLPSEQFERAVCNQSDGVYTALQGGYIKKGLEGISALAFTRAAIAYRALSGTLAYGEPNAALRQTDMYDCNFVPLELRLPVAEPVAAAIDAALCMQADMRIVPGEKRAMARKQAAIAAQRADAINRFESANVFAALTAAPCAEDAALAERRARWQHKQQRVIARRRFLRCYKNVLIACAVCAVLVGGIGRSVYRGNMTLATSKGLPSRETVETLYTGIHHSDVNVVREVTYGKKMANLLSVVSGIFVTAKERESRGAGNTTLSPAEWLFFKGEGTFWLYGLTQFAVDGIAADTSFAYPQRKDRPEPLSAEANLALTDGETTQHIVTYYRIYSDSSNLINIEEMSDTVTLTWRKNRWLVTSCENITNESTVKLKDVRDAYAAALEATDGDIAQAVGILRARFAWLPTDAELARAAE